MSESGGERNGSPDGIRLGTGGRHLGKGRPRVLQIVAISLVAVLVGAIAFVALSVVRLQGNVATEPLNLSTDGESQLPVDLSRDPVQILIIGSDTRAGQGADSEPEDVEGQADVMMLMTMSADRSNVTMVSFPRDLLVPLPACENPETGATSQPMALGQLNSSLANGGPGCTVAAINEITGLQIDHFMMADFNAVTELSKAVGGVEVCVNQAVDDEFSGLKLPAGTSEVEGEQALAFLRTRHSFGTGGDEGRIRAQQAFLASLARKIKEEGTLSNIPRLYSIAEAVTQNLTVDDGLAEIPELLKLAGRLQEVDLGNVAFVTVPVVPYELDPNRLVLDEDKADDLFAALRADRDITKPVQEPSPSASASPETDPSGTPEPTPEPEPTPTVEELGFDPALVPLTVLNASGESDRGQELQEVLLAEGYVQATVADADDRPATQLFVGPGYEGIAPVIAELFGLADVQVIPSATTVGLELSVGSDFTEGETIEAQGVAGDLSGQTAAQVTCQS
ncbi:LCP family protein [Arthrobacter parietis]|uniref:LCP family protein n=2 Tax=Arthrobacter TaxID=1663 RepID=A0ABT6CQW9_9MICC|nr:LCP family protein [Arthrobacter vasquezii]MDF9276403.1 LCP family protein [Arthrobacter vasquezii]